MQTKVCQRYVCTVFLTGKTTKTSIVNEKCLFKSDFRFTDHSSINNDGYYIICQIIVMHVHMQLLYCQSQCGFN